jgi:SulP family sulfate permease
MLGTVVVTVWTHDLARGVLTGVILSAIFFARKVGRMLDVDSSLSDDGVRTYVVAGQVFFASAEAFADVFDYKEEGLAAIRLDVGGAHFWDLTAVGALDRVVAKFAVQGVPVRIDGMNRASETLVARLRTPGALDPAQGH